MVTFAFFPPSSSFSYVSFTVGLSAIPGNIGTITHVGFEATINTHFTNTCPFRLTRQIIISYELIHFFFIFSTFESWWNGNEVDLLLQCNTDHNSLHKSYLRSVAFLHCIGRLFCRLISIFSHNAPRQTNRDVAISKVH